MSKRRKNAELSENLDNSKIRNEELEAENLMLKARILELETFNREFEEEIHQLKENCNCPKVKKLRLFILCILRSSASL